MSARRALVARLAVTALVARALIAVFVGAARLGGRLESQPAAGVPTPQAGGLVVPSTTPTPTSRMANPSPAPSLAPVPIITPNLPVSSPDAELVATRFALAYASYSYRDGPDAQAAALKPYVTDAYLQSMTHGGGGGQGAQDRVTRHEVATAQLVGLQDLGAAPDGRLVMVVTVSQTVVNDNGKTTSQRIEEEFVVKTAAGWRVEEVTLA